MDCNIRFDSENIALENQAVTTSFVKNRLVRVIEQVFDSHSTPQTVSRFNRLDIDLGQISMTEFPDELENRMRKKLDALLNQIHPSLETAPLEPEQDMIQTREKADQEVLFFFLENGFLPWYGPVPGNAEIKKNLDGLLLSQPQTLISFLKTLETPKPVIRRLHHQFGKKVLEKIHDLLLSEQAFKDPAQIRTAKQMHRIEPDPDEKAAPMETLLEEILKGLKNTFSDMIVTQNDPGAATDQKQNPAMGNTFIRQPSPAVRTDSGKISHLNTDQTTVDLPPEQLKRLQKKNADQGTMPEKTQAEQSDIHEAAQVKQLGIPAKLTADHTDNPSAIPADIPAALLNMLEQDPGLCRDIAEKPDINDLQQVIWFLIQNFIPASALADHWSDKKFTDLKNALPPAVYQLHFKADSVKAFLIRVFINLTRHRLNARLGIDQTAAQLSAEQLTRMLEKIADQGTMPGGQQTEQSDIHEAVQAKKLGIPAKLPADHTDNPSAIPADIPAVLLNMLEQDPGLCRDIAEKLDIKDLWHMILTFVETIKKESDRLDFSFAGFFQADTIHMPAAANETIYIQNAGMILAGPFLPQLFQKLELLAQKEFKSRDASEKAVHILEYLVNKQLMAPEYRLVLNKILCGIEPGIPVRRDIDLTEKDKDITQELIHTMITHWKAIGNTSLDGFRESFLIREGKLSLKDDAWSLLVESKPFDMLLDRIPWSFKTIRHPWMDRVIHVKWR